MIVILMGWSRSGKDYTYNQLREIWPDFQRVSFTRPLKAMIEDSLELPVNHLDTGEGKNLILPGTGKTILEWLIEANTEKSPAYTELWLSLARNQIDSLTSSGKVPVLTDLRNWHELTMIRSLDQEILPIMLLSSKAVQKESDQQQVAIFSQFTNGIKVWNDRETNAHIEVIKDHVMKFCK